MLHCFYKCFYRFHNIKESCLKEEKVLTIIFKHLKNQKKLIRVSLFICQTKATKLFSLEVVVIWLYKNWE